MKEAELKQVQTDVAELQSQLKKLIDMNSHVAQSQNEYRQEYDEKFTAYENRKARETELEIAIQGGRGRCEKLRIFTDRLNAFESSEIEFEQELWGILVEQATVNLDGSVTFRFLGGLETTV